MGEGGRVGLELLAGGASGVGIEKLTGNPYLASLYGAGIGGVVGWAGGRFLATPAKWIAANPASVAVAIGGFTLGWAGASSFVCAFDHDYFGN